MDQILKVRIQNKHGLSALLIGYAQQVRSFYINYDGVKSAEKGPILPFSRNAGAGTI